jgi:hypothetical protein
MVAQASYRERTVSLLLLPSLDSHLSLSLSLSLFSTFNRSFRPGPDLIEKEQIEEQKRFEEAQLAMSLTSKQEATDWSVQAVVDEDELFK